MKAATMRRQRLLPLLLLCVAMTALVLPRAARSWMAPALPASSSSTRSSTASASTSLEPSAPLQTKRVLRRALRDDSRQEYFLYIPSSGGQGAPLFVTVHGISRNAEEHATLFSAYAERYGVVLVAPCFTEKQHDDYQRLGRTGRGQRADFVLDSILAEVTELTGAAAAKIYLFGFSGGAQFAHRYTMAHPERIARAAIGAAGWYTFPDDQRPYPYGIGPSPELPSLHFDPAEFLRVPIAVFVGAEDSTNESFRRSDELDRQQGVTRFERARHWVAAMRAAAAAHHLEPLVTYEEVAGIHHSFRQFMEEGQLGDRVFGVFFGRPEAAKPRTGTGAAASDDRSGWRLLLPAAVMVCASPGGEH
ncbi:MAG TPA: PHB depolymerase family esterase [Candidatus Krumholzibacteria bacterium]|nr:PHB depolymerase family esterase [Candidatus Krumholzibacteria bacterium]